MELVVDANVLIAGFVRTAITRELLLDERLTLHMPEYGLTETTRVLNRARLRARVGLTSAQIQELLAHLTARIRLCAAATYRHLITEALRLISDPADAPYLALALHLRIPIWSNDAGFRQQRRVMIYTTDELLDILA